MPQDSEKQLFRHFIDTFLPKLHAKDALVLSALHRADCPLPESSGPPDLCIKLGTMFEALCISAQLHGLEAEVNDWGKSFKRFTKLLMDPWPLSAIAAAGYRVDLHHRSSSHVNCEYRFTAI